MMHTGGRGSGKTARMMAEAQAAADTGRPVLISFSMPDGRLDYARVVPSKTAVDFVLDGIEFLSWVGGE